MFQFRSFCIAVLIASLFTGIANAGFILSAEAAGVQSSQVAGVTTENFNGFSTGIYTTLNTAVGTITSPGLAITGANSVGGAGGTGNYFAIGGESGQLTATLTLLGNEKYFGIWLSAADPLNNVELLSSGTLLGQLNIVSVESALGSAYYGNPNGLGDGSEKFVYLNFVATGVTTFNQIIFQNANLSSGEEADNFSISATAPNPIPGTVIAGGIVPEPSSVILLICGATAMVSTRRRVRRVR